MSPARLLLIAGSEFRHAARRPIFWFLIVMLGFTVWGLSAGSVRIASGDSQVGGDKAWITSEFAVTQIASFLVLLLYAFFVAVAAGMAVIQDDENKIGALLHATPLTPTEYILGKFLGVMGAFTGVLFIQVLLTMLFNHLVPSEVADEVRGPFVLANYLKPALFLSLPTLFFLSATAFAVGVWTRRAILVFFLPVALILFCGFFLWDWSPDWLSPGWNRVLMVLDPAGFRWLNETWLKVDRGVAFYNHQPVGYDGIFWLNRGWQILAGIGAMVLAVRSFSSSLRGAKVSKAIEASAMRDGAALDTRRAADRAAESSTGLLSRLAMSSRPPSFISGLLTVAQAEFKELVSQPGLYLFIPLILLQVIGNNLFAVGAFDTPLLTTPGMIAVNTFNTLTLLLTLLLLFYTVEGMERERATQLDPIFRATPASTASMLVGKTLATAVVALVVLAAVLLGGFIVILVQGRVPFNPMPSLIVWSLFLLPTLVLWSTFLIAVHSLVKNRYLTYAVGLGVLILTGVLQTTGRMSWVGNWDMWRVLQWSDMGLFELDRTALLLNRLMAVGLAIFFIAVTMRLGNRRDIDASRLGQRLMPGSLLKGALRLLPFALLPIVAGTMLFFQVWNGHQGKAQLKKEKDYWRRNLATWKGAPLPDILHVDIDMSLEPSKRSFALSGSYRLINRLDKPLVQIPLTGHQAWKNLRWTMDGDSTKPDDRLKLFVFTPSSPLQPGDSLTIGFAYDGVWPAGSTKNGGGAGTFILPSGVVIHSFEPSFAPVLGYVEQVGIDKDNRYDSKDFPEDHYKGITRAGLGTQAPFTTRIRVTGPAEYRYNSVGTLVDDQTTGSRRTMTWASDHPVNFFNIVAGRWKEKRAEGTAIYYHPSHHYNIEEMSEALAASKRYYSEWFYPFPWQELKLSEFPGLDTYAQGFATNITFSEQIGFLTKSDPRANVAFMVTAHEAAHQWWGNILTPGEGPGGDILSEGMAHFSTILLFDQVKGPEQRIEFCKRIEGRYADRRQVDSERPLVKIDGTKDGDTTVIYDKGGWVFWMLLNQMGREPALAGYREFIHRYANNRDHAQLEDFTAVMREFAPDTTAHDAFVKQWFHEVVAPEYKLTEARKSGSGDSWEVAVKVTNSGQGLMPVEVAAIAGKRFPKDSAGDVPAGDAYREARTTVILDAGESTVVTLNCPFEPKSVLVDPDALVLQLNRKNAIAKL